ncbi:REP-associated tyrosine transposase [Chromobacterium amazonense]|uniref:REP-associated tyrosine transposase n=1 Tax=Chromobacterium amazonense TaxID=1382803 RepID=UPI0031F6FC78
MRYRRLIAEGGTWFLTVNLADRRQDYLTRHIDVLRQAVRQVRDRHPFEIVAMVVLPDHFHAVWTLPEGDADYPTRMTLIKAAFSRTLPKIERIRESRERKRERGIWQRRYWEHQIRDEADLQAHVDYIHYNPVKHGHVERVVEWPYSSFHRYVRLGWLPEDWAGESVVAQLQE